MLQFTELQSGNRIWVNPRQVAALAHLKDGDCEGCVLLLAGGFELQVRESAAEVSAQVQKRLDAY